MNIKARNHASHLESSRERLFANVLELEEYRYKGGGDNGFTIGLKLMCIVLKQYNQVDSFISTINGPGSIYPIIPQSQLKRISKYIT